MALITHSTESYKVQVVTALGSLVSKDTHRPNNLTREGTLHPDVLLPENEPRWVSELCRGTRKSQYVRGCQQSRGLPSPEMSKK